MNNVKISTSCLEGYLTKACPHCVFWSDGDNELLNEVYPMAYGRELGASVGCCIPAPIGDCPFFRVYVEGKNVLAQLVQSQE